MRTVTAFNNETFARSVLVSMPGYDVSALTGEFTLEVKRTTHSAASLTFSTAKGNARITAFDNAAKSIVLALLASAQDMAALSGSYASADLVYVQASEVENVEAFIFDIEAGASRPTLPTPPAYDDLASWGPIIDISGAGQSTVLQMLQRGLTGPAGLKGDRGDQGIQGVPGSDGAAGTPGTPGTNGTNGANGTAGSQIIATAGTPSAGTGANGDYALDQTAKVVYGPKAAGTWPAGAGLGGLVLKRVDVLTTSGTYTKQAGDTLYIIRAVGGGGGGGSGARQATGTNAGGGGGGEAGQNVICEIAASELAASFSYVIGAGGTAGASVSDTSNGAAGASGGATSFDSLYVRGGGGGGGGTSAAGGAAGRSLGTPGALSSISIPANITSGVAGSLVAGLGGWAYPNFASGGGGGAGISANTAYAGGIGVYANYGLYFGGNGGVAGGAAGGGNGTNGVAAPNNYTFGSGGSGGGSAIAAASGNGGAGGLAGGGGGGGAGGRNTFTGGAGGEGGAGRIIVLVFG